MSDLEKPGLVFSLKRILLFRGFKTKHICTMLHIDFIAAILKKKECRWTGSSVPIFPATSFLVAFLVQHLPPDGSQSQVLTCLSGLPPCLFNFLFCLVAELHLQLLCFRFQILLSLCQGLPGLGLIKEDHMFLQEKSFQLLSDIYDFFIQMCQ